jgi:hypothetical protein
VLINWESSIGALLLTILLQVYPCYYLALSFYSCTCWVPTISVLNLAISPCCTNLLLRSWRRSGVLWYGVLGERLPRSIACGVMVSFRCYVIDSARFCLLWDIIHEINTLYRDIGYSVSISVRYVWKLDSWAHILWAFGLALKLGVIEVVPEPCRP